MTKEPWLTIKAQVSSLPVQIIYKHRLTESEFQSKFITEHLTVLTLCPTMTMFDTPSKRFFF